MQIQRSGAKPSGKGPADWFTGTVRIDPLFSPPDPARVSGALVTFEPGARTAWHTHPLGQTLGGTPVGKNPDQLAAFEMRLDLLLGEICQTETLQRGIHHERRCVEHQLTFHPHPQITAIPLKLPCVNAAMCGQP